MINNGYNSDECRLDFFRYCVGKGMGIRDDTVLCEGFSGSRYDNLKTPFLFDEFYENAPVDIESGEEHLVFFEKGRNLNWKAESHNIESFKLDLQNVKYGEYTICIGLLRKKHR